MIARIDEVDPHRRARAGEEREGRTEGRGRARERSVLALAAVYRSGVLLALAPPIAVEGGEGIVLPPEFELKGGKAFDGDGALALVLQRAGRGKGVAVFIGGEFERQEDAEPLFFVCKAEAGLLAVGRGQPIKGRAGSDLRRAQHKIGGCGTVLRAKEQGGLAEVGAAPCREERARLFVARAVVLGGEERSVLPSARKLFAEIEEPGRARIGAEEQARVRRGKQKQISLLFDHVGLRLARL